MAQVKIVRQCSALSVLLVLVNVASLNAQETLKKASVLEKMTLANNYFMKKWPDPTVNIVTDKSRPSNIWTRAVYYEGLVAMYRIDPETMYHNYIQGFDYFFNHH